MATTNQFFRVLPDSSVVDAWFLDEPITDQGEVIDPRLFIAGVSYNGPFPVKVPVYKTGSNLAFNFAAFDMPVVTSEVAAVIRKHAKESVQLFPVNVGEEGAQYFVLNVNRAIECVDDDNSEATKWTPMDDRPDKIGQYRLVTKLAIAPERVGQQHIFRIKGWEIAMIVSECVRDALRQIPGLGVVFQEVA